MNSGGFGASDIEQAIVSAMLQWPEAINEASALLSEEHFAAGANRTLFREVLGQFNEGKKIELILFTQHLRDRGILEAVGGAYYVTSTYADVCHSPKVMSFYIDRLLEEFERRKLVHVCKESIESAMAGDEDAVPRAVTAISEVPARRGKERTLAEATFEKLDRLENGLPDADVVITELQQLDKFSPLRRGDMPLITGERKAGKSVLALTIALNVAKNGLPVLYFSLEDREPKVLDRLFAGFSRIPLDCGHVKKMSPEQISKASDALPKIGQLPITIKDDVCDLLALISISRILCGRGKVGLIIVDYAQLVRCPGTDSRREEVEKVSRDLRMLAMELNVPLILLCQLNKEGETRETKALEMDATAAWQIDVAGESQPNKRFLRVPWQRNGESGISFPVTFLGSIARVENYSDDDL